jgi:dienelactone hydrolase
MAQWFARTLVVVGLVVGVVVPVAGCGVESADRVASPVASSSPANAPSSTPWAALPGLGRCGPQPPQLAEVRYRRTTLRSPGRSLPAVVTGHGRTVVVLVHQTDGGGLCGWLSFAARIAAVPGQTALAFDLCGYGDADCAPGNTAVPRQVEQVRLAIDAAQRRLHARRIVLVGASMGGSLAVLTAARDHRVDAAVDLSGPDEWQDAHVSRHAADVQVPLLVAMATDEGADAVAAARATADAGAPGSAFVGAEAGHGYALLEDTAGAPTPIAERVLELIAAR